MGKTKLSVHVFGKRKKMLLRNGENSPVNQFSRRAFFEKKYEEDEQNNSAARNKIAEYITNISEKSK